MTGAQALIKVLEQNKTTTIFGYPGAANGPIYDELSKSTIKHILTRQEQGAAHAASGYARVTGKVGVCMATSGPGATNLITGIATAYMDSIPIVAITGQVSTQEIGRDVFQEVDITGATAPFCKHNYLVKDANKLVKIVNEAFYIASTGRPGPVLIDIPIDIQQKEISFLQDFKPDIRGYKPTYEGHGLQIKKIIKAIQHAQRPVICAGGGVIASNASQELLAIAEKVGIPIVTTLMGISAFPATHTLYLGMIGSHGVYAANKAVANADLLIVMGARAGDRATAQADKFARQAQIVHIDIDPAEIGKNLGANIPIVGDVKTILTQMLKHITISYKQEWTDNVVRWKQENAKKDSAKKDAPYVSPQYVLNVLSQLTKGEAIVTTEVGQNQIWAANNYKPTVPGYFLTSGGLGTMGYGLPAAIGAKLGAPDKEVITISGDGSFQMNMQELATIKQWGADVKILLFNNARLGMVRELQKMRFKSNYYATTLDGNPDFVKIAAAYDIPAEKVVQNAAVEETLKRALAYNGSYLIEFSIDPEESTL